MEENNSLTVGGYCFGTAEDAEIARQEEKKVEYLEQHMDYTKMENVLQVYKKAIESRIFQTPVGWEYMRKLQKRLWDWREKQNAGCEKTNSEQDLGANSEQGLGRNSEQDSEQVPPVVLYTVFAHRVGDEIRVPAPRMPEKKKNTLKARFAVSVIVNVLLAVAVGAMFYITLTSDNPNILNYERVLVNKYSAWEQELSEREREVRNKERELMADE